jgi:RNA-directed DNA polymerase
LKCDIKKFFASIDHQVLLQILKKYLRDERTLSLLTNIITSFTSGTPGKGLPLGNLTSQLLVNIYMNEFDQYVKHKLKVKYYIRYADDFVFLSANHGDLVALLPNIKEFLGYRLKLELHPAKVFIKTFASGIDFLGWVHFSDHRVLRTATRRRMFRQLTETNFKEEIVQSYLGLLKHGNTYLLRQVIFNAIVDRT